MQKTFIKIWLLVFLFSLMPPSEYLADLTVSVPMTSAESMRIEGNALPFTLKADGTKQFRSDTISSAFPFQTLVVSWQGDPNAQVLVRIQEEDNWSDWRPVELQEDMNETDTGTNEFLFAKAGQAFQYGVILHPEGGYPVLEHIEITYLRSQPTAPPRTTAQAASFQIQPRSAWAADENLRKAAGWQKEREAYCKKTPWACLPLTEKVKEENRKKREEILLNYPEEMKLVQTVAQEDGETLVWPKDYPTKIRKIVLHHTGEDFDNEDGEESAALTTSDYQARIRTMYYYHTIVRGWGDIGYNLIVDPLGNVYEGRAGGERVTGAHVAWHNEGSVGIGVMGSFDSHDVPPGIQNTIVQVLTYISKKFNLDPQGTGSFRGKMLPNIIGHRDLAATACPGGKLYEKLPQLRLKVSHALQSKETVPVPILGEINQANDQYSAEYVSTNIAEISVSPTSAESVNFQFKNMGTEAWNGDTFLDVCCSLDSTLNIVRDDKLHATTRLQNAPVLPGQLGNFTVVFTAGYVEKVALITLTPVINGQTRVQSVILPVSVTTPSYAYEYVTARYPKNRLLFGEKTTAEVTLKNTSSITWVNTGENAIVLKPDRPRLRVTDFHPEDNTVLATLREERVFPGQVGHFIFNLTAPQKFQAYQEYFTPFIKQVGYLEDKGMFFQLVVLDPTNALDYNFNQENPPTLSFLSQEKKTVGLTLRNTDQRTWRDLHNKAVMLGSSGAAVASQVSFDKNMVPPGETVTLFTDVQAPATSGRHVLSLMPRMEGVNLFNRTLEVTLYVAPQTAGARLVEEFSLTPPDPVSPENIRIQLRFQNTGNLPWYKGSINLGKFYDRNRPSPLYHPSWPAPLRPATLEEEVVQPGETGTFIFRGVASRSGLMEESYKLGIQGTGWVNMHPVLVRFYVTGDTSRTTTVSAPPPAPAPVTQENNSSLKSLSQKNIRVKLSFAPADNRGVVSLSQVGKVQSGSASFALEANQEVTVTYENNQLVARANNQTLTGESVTLVPQGRALVSLKNWEHYPAWDTNKQYNDNVFRGSMRVLAEDGKLVFINELSLEDYIQGVAEVPENSTHEKKKVMSILARTYALFYLDPANRKFPGKSYDASDNPDVFQKYLGYTYEMRSPDFSKAVTETRGLVVTYQGKLIKTPYFNQSDGRTRSAEEVWGWKDTPYLVSIQDPLCGDKTLRGHGVGLSGCGAEEAAKLGHKYEQIIKYYYQGVAVTKME